MHIVSATAINPAWIDLTLLSCDMRHGLVHRVLPTSHLPEPSATGQQAPENDSPLVEENGVLVWFMRDLMALWIGRQLQVEDSRWRNSSFIQQFISIGRTTYRIESRLIPVMEACAGAHWIASTSISGSESQVGRPRR